MNRLRRRVGGRHEGGANAERGNVRVRAPVGAAGNGGVAVVGVVGDELVHFRARHVHQHHVAGCGGLLDDAVGVANGDHHRIDLVVAKRLGLLGGFQLAGELEVVVGPAEGGHQLLHRAALPGTRIADVHALALQIREGGDVRVRTRHHGEGLGVNREHRAQFRVGAAAIRRRELVGAVVGVVLHIGLRHAHVQLAGGDGVEVVDGAAGGLDAAAHAVLGGVLVDQAADLRTGRVVDAGDAGGADGDEGARGLLGGRGVGRRRLAGRFAAASQQAQSGEGEQSRR